MLVLVLVLLVSLTGCTTHSAELKQGLKRWEADIPSSYVAIIQQTGFSGNGARLWLVDQGEVSDCWIDQGETTCVPKTSEDDSDPITDLYGRAIDHDRCKVTAAEVDDEYNYLANYHLDCESEGYGEIVTCFAADSSDAADCDM